MTKFFRSIKSGFCFSIFGVGGFIIGSVLFPIVFVISRKQSRKILTLIVHKSWKCFVWIMESMGLIKLDISDVDRKKLLSMNGKVVVANHPSLIDIVILISLIPNAVCVVKGSLIKNIWMTFIVRFIYITNNGNVDDFLSDAGRALQAGFNVIIFPEGTRTLPGIKEHKLHRGFAQLSLHNGADILPIIISSNPPVLGKLQKWWQIGDKTSVFSVKLKNDVVVKYFENTENFHHSAKILTEKIKSVLFPN